MTDEHALPPLAGCVAALAAAGRTIAQGGHAEAAELLAAVAHVLRGTAGDAGVVWLVSSDGARMRLLALPGLDAGASEAGAAPSGEVEWQPVAGPVSEVLRAGGAIDLGVQDAPGHRDAPGHGDAPRGRRPAQPFGRFLPVSRAGRVLGVLGVLRRPGRPAFSRDDQVVLQALVDRVEAALALQQRTDELAAERNRRMDVVGGVVMHEDLLERLGTIAGDIVFRYRVDAGMEYVSIGVERLLGYTAEELRQDPGLVRRILHPDDRHLVREVLRDPARAEQPLVVRLIARDGQLSWHFLRLVPITDATGRVLGVEGLSTDVTEMKLHEEALSQLARTDALTGLANRTTFHDFAAKSLSRLARHGGMVGVLFLDLDGFKAVNDTLGHAAGDELLVRVAERLLHVVRREDVVARLGGDEFGVLLTQLTHPGEATVTSERILAALERPIEVAGTEAAVSAGIGVAVTSAGTISPDELIQRADAALYQAKRTGRGRWQVFQGGGGTRTEGVDTPLPGMVASRSATAGAGGGLGAPASGVAGSEAELRAALHAGEIQPRYLPQVSTASGEVQELEALARWTHPDRGELVAAAFLPSDAGGSLLAPLGDAVLRAAARQVTAWSARSGRKLRLRVNVFPSQLAQAGFAAAMLQVLRASGVAPAEVGVDVPEAVIAAPDTQTVANLEALVEAGVRIGVDDFGTGAASLRALRRFPLDQVKIDRSLITTLGRDGGDDALVALAVRLAASLGARAVAEGVEDGAQLARLRALGCGALQGFLVAAPMTATEVDVLLDAGRLDFAAAVGTR